MHMKMVASLAASALLGLGALVLVKAWEPSRPPLAGHNDDANTVPMVVATGPLAFGVRLEARHLTVVRAPAAAVPKGAFSSPAALLQQAGGAPVVLTPIAEREPLLPSKLSGPGARPSLAAEIGQDKRAYTIRVSDVSGVGGHALPGDRVDVVLTRDLSEETRTRKMLSEVVIQNVRVLGVDLNADPATTKPVTPRTATLEVAVEEAQKLAVAAELGTLSLALRGQGAAEIAKVRPIQARDVGSSLPGAEPSRQPRPWAQPAARGPRTLQASATVEDTSPLVIVQGGAVTRLSVAKDPAGGGA